MAAGSIISVQLAPVIMKRAAFPQQIYRRQTERASRLTETPVGGPCDECIGKEVAAAYLIDDERWSKSVRIDRN